MAGVIYINSYCESVLEICLTLSMLGKIQQKTFSNIFCIFLRKKKSEFMQIVISQGENVHEI